MPVRDYSEKQICTAHPDELARAVAERLRAQRAGCIVVTGSTGPLGVVTDRELSLGVLCDRLDPDAVRVQDLIQRPLLSIGEEEPLSRATDRMRSSGVRRLPVLDPSGTASGLVTADGLFLLVASELSELARAVRAQCPEADTGPPRTHSSTEHYRREVATIAGDATASEVADQLRAQGVGCLVVLDGERPAGLLTDRDLLERVLAARLDPARTRAHQVMSHPLRSADSKAPLEQVVRLMAEYKIRRVPILHEGELAGIVSLDDVLAELSDELHELTGALRHGFEAAQRAATAHRLALDLERRIRELTGTVEHLSLEARDAVVGQIDALRERLKRPDR